MTLREPNIPMVSLNTVRRVTRFVSLETIDHLKRVNVLDLYFCPVRISREPLANISHRSGVSSIRRLRFQSSPLVGILSPFSLSLPRGRFEAR